MLALLSTGNLIILIGAWFIYKKFNAAAAAAAAAAEAREQQGR